MKTPAGVFRFTSYPLTGVDSSFVVLIHRCRGQKQFQYDNTPFANIFPRNALQDSGNHSTHYPYLQPAKTMLQTIYLASTFLKHLLEQRK